MQDFNKSDNNNQKRITKGTVSKEVKDYSNDPFVLKKARKSQEFLEKHGFPEELIRIKQAKYGK